MLRLLCLFLAMLVALSQGQLLGMLASSLLGGGPMMGGMYGGPGMYGGGMYGPYSGFYGKK